jgi:hypothetical protein
MSERLPKNVQPYADAAKELAAAIVAMWEEELLSGAGERSQVVDKEELKAKLTALLKKEFEQVSELVKQGKV